MLHAGTCTKINACVHKHNGVLLKILSKWWRAYFEIKQCQGEVPANPPLLVVYYILSNLLNVCHASHYWVRGIRVTGSVFKKIPFKHFVYCKFNIISVIISFSLLFLFFKIKIISCINHIIFIAESMTAEAFSSIAFFQHLAIGFLSNFVPSFSR